MAGREAVYKMVALFALGLIFVSIGFLYQRNQRKAAAAQ